MVPTQPPHHGLVAEPLPWLQVGGGEPDSSRPFFERVYLGKSCGARGNVFQGTVDVSGEGDTALKL